MFYNLNSLLLLLLNHKFLCLGNTQALTYPTNCALGIDTFVIAEDSVST